MQSNADKTVDTYNQTNTKMYTFYITIQTTNEPMFFNNLQALRNTKCMLTLTDTTGSGYVAFFGVVVGENNVKINHLFD